MREGQVFSFQVSTRIVMKVIGGFRVGAKWVESLGSYFIECDGEQPDIVFGINGNSYTITAKNYKISVSSSHPSNVAHSEGSARCSRSIEKTLFLQAGAALCMFGFFPSTASGFYPSWMLGPPLIREYCQIHDMQAGTIGMAKSVSA